MEALIVIYGSDFGSQLISFSFGLNKFGYLEYMVPSSLLDIYSELEIIDFIVMHINLLKQNHGIWQEEREICLVTEP